MSDDRVSDAAWLWDLLCCASLVLWLSVRFGALGMSASAEPGVLGLPNGPYLLPFLFLDWSWLALVPLVSVCALRPPSRIAAALVVAILASVHGAIYVSESLTRYYRGDATAYDLGNFIHPLFRVAADPDPMSGWRAGLPLWADHGSWGMIAFAPFTRLFADAATGVLVVQALVAASWIVAVYLLARALAVPAGLALLATAAAASSRAIHFAVLSDFHPECAMPVLLLLALAAVALDVTRWPLFALVLALASLKEMVALTVGMGMLYLALSRRSRSILVAAGLALGIAALDVLVVPGRLTDYSYLDMYTRVAPDLPLGTASALLRALSTMLLGSLHPFTWFAGAPWAAAAALSPKAITRGIEYHYSFLFVPVALAGALYALSWLSRWPRIARAVGALWALGMVSVNAPPKLASDQLMAAHGELTALRARLNASNVAPRTLSVAADACTSPYLVDRMVLTGICRLDTERFARTGEETWDEPVAAALHADRIVVNPGCTAHGRCLELQLQRAQAAGYRAVAGAEPVLVLEHPGAADHGPRARDATEP